MSEKQMRLGALEAGGTKMVCAVVSGDGEVLVERRELHRPVDVRRGDPGADAAAPGQQALVGEFLQRAAGGRRGNRKPRAGMCAGNDVASRLTRTCP